MATAHLIQPIHAGAGNLYSRECFTPIEKVLAADGLALRWIGDRPDTQYKWIMRTFLDVFPETRLWLDGRLMVVGEGALLTDDRALAEYHRPLPANDPPVNLAGVRGDVTARVRR